MLFTAILIRLKKIPLLFSFFLLFPIVINANTSSGFYIGGGPGAGVQYFVPEETLFTIPDAAHPTLGFRAFGGYQFNRYWGTEIGYSNMGPYKNHGTSPSSLFCLPDKCYHNKIPDIVSDQVNVQNFINSSAIDWTLLFRYPIFKKVDLFVKGGVAYMNADIKSEANIQIYAIDRKIINIYQVSTSNNQSNFWGQLNPVAGIGSEYFFSDQISVRFEYDYYFDITFKGAEPVNSGTLYPSIILCEFVYHF